MQDTNITNYHVLRPLYTSPISVDTIFSIYFGFQHHAKQAFGIYLQKWMSTLEAPLTIPNVLN